MKTWDVLDRKTGEVLWSPRLYDWESMDGWIETDEVAYCRETGEVVYL